jgi:hypothetical protein
LNKKESQVNNTADLYATNRKMVKGKKREVAGKHPSFRSAALFARSYVEYTAPEGSLVAAPFVSPNGSESSPA